MEEAAKKLDPLRRFPFEAEITRQVTQWLDVTASSRSVFFFVDLQIGSRLLDLVFNNLAPFGLFLDQSKYDTRSTSAKAIKTTVAPLHSNFESPG